MLFIPWFPWVRSLAAAFVFYSESHSAVIKVLKKKQESPISLCFPGQCQYDHLSVPCDYFNIIYSPDHAFFTNHEQMFCECCSTSDSFITVKFLIKLCPPSTHLSTCQKILLQQLVAHMSNDICICVHTCVSCGKNKLHIDQFLTEHPYSN